MDSSFDYSILRPKVRSSYLVSVRFIPSIWFRIDGGEGNTNCTFIHYGFRCILENLIMDMVEKHAAAADIENEVRAQIDLAHEWGMKPSHIDNHMGSLYGNQTGRFSLLKLAYKICGSYGYPYRMYIKADKRVDPRGIPHYVNAAAAALSRKWAKKYKVITPDYLLFPDWDAPDMKNCEKYEDYRKRILEIWSDIPDGVTETFVHPSVESDELKSITNAWKRRVWEYMLLKDPETEKFLNEHGVYFISYRDLVDLRFGIKEP